MFSEKTLHPSPRVGEKNLIDKIDRRGRALDVQQKAADWQITNPFGHH
jgi:hypothetical protein